METKDEEDETGGFGVSSFVYEDPLLGASSRRHSYSEAAREEVSHAKEANPAKEGRVLDKDSFRHDGIASRDMIGRNISNGKGKDEVLSQRDSGACDGRDERTEEEDGGDAFGADNHNNHRFHGDGNAGGRDGTDGANGNDGIDNGHCRHGTDGDGGDDGHQVVDGSRDASKLEIGGGEPEFDGEELESEGGIADNGLNLEVGSTGRSGRGPVLSPLSSEKEFERSRGGRVESEEMIAVLEGEGERSGSLGFRLQDSVDGQSRGHGGLREEVAPGEQTEEVSRFVEPLAFDDSYLDMLADMEDVLMDNADDFIIRPKPAANHRLPHGSSRSRGSFARPPPEIFHIDAAEVVGARLVEGQVSLGDRLVGVKSHAVYIVKVWSGSSEWIVEKRFREFLRLKRALESFLIVRHHPLDGGLEFNAAGAEGRKHGHVLPEPWSRLDEESKHIVGNTTSAIVSSRQNLLNQCLQAALAISSGQKNMSTVPPLKTFLSPEPEAGPEPGLRQGSRLGAQVRNLSRALRDVARDRAGWFWAEGQAGGISVSSAGPIELQHREEREAFGLPQTLEEREGWTGEEGVLRGFNHARMEEEEARDGGFGVEEEASSLSRVNETNDAAPDEDFGQSVRLLLDVRIPRKADYGRRLKEQQSACAGCFRPLDARYLPPHKTASSLLPSSLLSSSLLPSSYLPASAPRLCFYSGRFFCGACHVSDSAIIPALVLHKWDFAVRPVCQMVKAYLDSIYDKPLLCLSAVNPLLRTRVPILAVVTRLRRHVALCYSSVSCKMRPGIAAALGSRGYLLMRESEEFFALRDLVDLSRGQFAELPEMMRRIVKQLRNHVVSRCVECGRQGVPCGAVDSSADASADSSNLDCLSPAALVYSFQVELGEARLCKKCKKIFHSRCLLSSSVCCDQESKARAAKAIVSAVRSSPHVKTRNRDTELEPVHLSLDLDDYVFSSYNGGEDSPMSQDFTTQSADEDRAAQNSNLLVADSSSYGTKQNKRGGMWGPGKRNVVQMEPFHDG